MEKRTSPENQGIELGKVKWYRDYDKALEQSILEHKPVLLFFQEIPGCSTCINFGREVLSHPLMVEFIENEFIPLAIYNNRPGTDHKILNLYNEPAWNNPVAHFIDSKGKDIIPKLANNYRPLSMYNKMAEVMVKLGKSMPAYAILLGGDLKMDYGDLKSVVYQTPCFWSGEISMASHPAVNYTEAGWVEGSEVVKVFFDGSLVSQQELDTYATIEGFLAVENHHGYKTDETPQYCLSKSPFSFLPLSKAQRSAINVAIAYGKHPEQYLSPKQQVLYREALKGAGKDGRGSSYKEELINSWIWH